VYGKILVGVIYRENREKIEPIEKKSIYLMTTYGLNKYV